MRARIVVFFPDLRYTMRMNIFDLIQRQAIPEPWAEGEKIPWNDPAFSERMLREHLSQAHDLASRRTERIERHVDWIHSALLGGEASAILDLGCGPGLYATRFAARGHRVTGIDYGPASVRYARLQAAESGLPCEIIESDIRKADYGVDRFDLAMLIFGEFNVFHPDDARAILRKAHTA
ncbi:MAG: class I SAM-dependent methyltransferase, partial [Caldilineaceae bacterium]|nr:class I SAM-dependent methyltransferase [Caldilineaceae bacterium]